jgi:hypothetical protein
VACQVNILLLRNFYDSPIKDAPFIVGALWDVLSREMKEFTIAMCDEMWKRSKLLEDTIGALVSQARESCSLSYLIGASIICYGVHTIISKCEDNLESKEACLYFQKGNLFFQPCDC